MNGQPPKPYSSSPALAPHGLPQPGSEAEAALFRRLLMRQMESLERHVEDVQRQQAYIERQIASIHKHFGQEEGGMLSSAIAPSPLTPPHSTLQ